MVAPHTNPSIPPPRFLNRLSDLLFTMARAANLRAGGCDVTRTQGSPLRPRPPGA